MARIDRDARGSARGESGQRQRDGRQTPGPRTRRPREVQGSQSTDEGLERAHNALQTYCIIERFLANVLEVEEFRDEARALESVIDDTVAERLDTIIDRPEQCPDCFDAEADCCELLELEAGSHAD